MYYQLTKSEKCDYQSPLHFPKNLNLKLIFEYIFEYHEEQCLLEQKSHSLITNGLQIHTNLTRIVLSFGVFKCQNFDFGCFKCKV